MSSAQPWHGRRLHFVGMGGSGMSGLAFIAHRLGAEVTGSDRAPSRYVGALATVGIEPTIGHAAANVPDGAEVVYSSAIAAENPERAAARERGLRELHRADLLGELTALRSCIAVTGAHGKTTTASMVVHVLRGCGLDPSYALGGKLRSTGVNAGWGEGAWLVVEADESDRSLLKLHPDVAVLTNVEMDHHTTYGSRLEIEDTIRAFLARAPEAVIWDRPALLALRDGPVVPYDVAGPQLEAAGSCFTWRGHEVRVGAPGHHNARNAVAALEAARLAGADPAVAAAEIASFTGAVRRFEPLGTTAVGARVFDDYAHHPTEVRATLEAARTLAPDRLVAVFQPALLSRTAELARELGEAMALADLPVVLEVYPDRERWEDYPGVSGRLVAAAAADAAEGRPVAWLPGFDDAEGFLRAALHEGDLCLVLGSGNVHELGRRLVA